MTLEPTLPIIIEPPLTLSTEPARAYVGLTREMWQQAHELGIIRPLPFNGPRNARLYSKVHLLEQTQAYLNFLAKQPTSPA